MQTARDAPALAVLRELLHDARDELLALDGDGLIVEANAAAARRLRRPSGFLVGKPFAALVALPDRPRVREALRNAGRDPLDLPLRLEDGNAAVTATIRAVVADRHRHVTIALRAEDDGLAPAPAPTPAAFDLTGFLLRLPQAVLAIDRRGRIALANRRARTLLAPARIRVGAELPDAGPAGAIRALAERLTVTRAPLPPRIVQLDGARTLRVSGTPAHGDEPAIIQLEDVTQEWQQDQRKREFVRNAAHQLRTPLAAISGAIDVLDSGGKDDPEIRDRFLAHIRTHADRLTRLTRALLVLERLEAVESVRLDFVELRPLLDALVAEAGNTPVAVDCPPSLAVLGDRDLTHEALAALVDNAVKHARTDVAITVDEALDTGTLAIHVSDSGPGIPAELRARILEPFFQGGTNGDGFGLGLAIAARAVAAMGGELTVDDVERGTRVTVHLRAATVVR